MTPRAGCFRVLSSGCPAGSARQHLQAWIAAAGKLQRAWRAHRFRSRLEAGRGRRRALLERIARVQALWRGRKDRLAFAQTRCAAVRLQVAPWWDLGE